MELDRHGLMEGRKRLAIVPAYNEEPNVSFVVEAIHRDAPEFDVLVIDDGSTDATAQQARVAGAEVLVHPFNLGIGGAMQSGYRYACEQGYQEAIQVDGDGQHDPAEIPAFLGEHARGVIGGEPAELIVGARSFRRMPPARRAANWLGTVTLSAALGRWIADNQSGYRLVGRRLMGAMLDSREQGFSFEVEMIAVCLREGWPISWIPVRTIYADERSHIRPGQHVREFLAVTGRARRIARARPKVSE
jgi:glycosyltransferase involved in cell wall biosynthesis